MANLRFADPLIAPVGVVNLEFGETAGAGLNTDLIIQSTLPAPVGVVVAGMITPMALVDTLAPPTGVVEILFDANVWRGISAQTDSAWQDAARADVALVDAFQAPALLRSAKVERGEEGGHVAAEQTVLGLQPPELRIKLCGTMTDADWLPAAPHEVAGQPTERVRRDWVGDAEQATPGNTDWQVIDHLTKRLRSDRVGRFDEAADLGRAFDADWQSGLPYRIKTCTAFQQAGRAHDLPRPVVPVIPPTTPGCYTPPVGVVHLQFYEAPHTDFNLAFACVKVGQVVVPIRRAYIVTNSASLVRLPGLENIPAYGLTVSADADSWTWSLSANLPASALDMVAPQGGAPTEVRATINGIQWVFLVESIRRTREFGKSGISIGGRSRSAWLADPYAAKTNHASASAITAQQIVNAALPSGWTLDWQATDWLVPAGLWASHDTPLGVALEVAAAIGAMTQSHRTNQNLIIAPRYPVKPWELGTATPSMQIPASVIVTEGVEWSELPAYNRVFVSGEAQGIVGQITRTGTAGDLVAEMVTHRLITDTAAASQRGTVILSNTGRQAKGSFALPIIPADGLNLLTPGQVVEIVDSSETWRGYVRGVSVNANLPTVRQTVEIERHL